MKPQRSYLVRALYDWVLDNEDLPYALVDATVADVKVPLEHVEDGKIVLNLGPNAVRNLTLALEYVMCNGRFGGREFELFLPMASILAIYGRDSGQGMVFPEEALLEPVARGENPEQTHSSDEAAKSDNAPAVPDKPTLRLV